MYSFFWIKYEKYDFFPVCIVVFIVLSSVRWGFSRYTFIHDCIIIKL